MRNHPRVIDVSKHADLTAKPLGKDMAVPAGLCRMGRRDMDIQIILQQFVNGINIGTIYALLGVGFTMTYGVVHIFNFAHGEFYMLAPFAVLATLSVAGTSLFSLGQPIAVIILVAIAISVSGLAGYLVERFAYRPIDRRLQFPPLVSSLGAAMFIQHVVMVIGGRQYLNFPSLIKPTPINVGGVYFSSMDVLFLLTAVVLMFILNRFVYGTKVGIALRAIYSDPQTTSLMGVDVNRAISTTYIVGSALAGVGGMMVALRYGLVYFLMGFFALIKGFVVAVVGGMGNIHGAILGGYVLGLVEAFGGGFLANEWKDAFAFLILIAIIIIKPTGLLGIRGAEAEQRV